MSDEVNGISVGSQIKSVSWVHIAETLYKDVIEQSDEKKAEKM